MHIVKGKSDTMVTRIKRKFNNKTFLLDRKGTNKKALQNIAKSGKKFKAIKGYRITKQKGKYSLWIKP